MSSGHDKPRILIAPVEIAGYYNSLCQGFHALGVHCDFVTFTPHPFAYGGETRDSVLLRAIRWLHRLQAPGRALPLRLLAFAPLEALKALWLLLNAARYDIFIFGFGQSLLAGNLDIPLLRALGKTVICNIGHGTEARPPYINGAHQSPDGKQWPTLRALARGTRRRATRMRRLQRRASLLVGAPYSSTQLCSARMVNWFALGIPFNAAGHSAQHSAPAGAAGDPVRILHAPSHPALKGTPRIRAAIAALRERGHAIDYVELQGRPFSEVLAELASCDFVVDQIYSDTPMATFSTEAAWFGKPAVVGGYGLDSLDRFIPHGMLPPSRCCHPDELLSAVEELLLAPEKRRALGSAARDFVQETWSAPAVAQRYLRMIAGDIPDDWWLDPQSVVYLHGCGQPVSRTRKHIAGLIARYGIDALQLGQRPELEQAAQRLARESAQDEAQD